MVMSFVLSHVVRMMLMVLHLGLQSKVSRIIVIRLHHLLTDFMVVSIALGHMMWMMVVVLQRLNLKSIYIG